MDVTTTRPLLRGSVSYDDSFNVPPNFGKIGTGIGNLANAGGEFLKNIATLITNQQVRDALIQQAQQQIKHSLHQELNHPLYRQYNNNYDPALLGELAKVYTAGLLEGTGRLADSTTNTLFADLPNTFYGTNRYNDLRATTVEDFVKKLTGTTTQGHPFTAGIGDLAANLTVGDYVAGKLLNPVILNASERSIPFSHIVNQIPRRSAPQVEKSLPPVPQKRWDPVPGSYNNPYGGLYEAFRNFPTTAIGDSQGSVRQEWLFQAIEKLAQQMVPPPPFALPTGPQDIFAGNPYPNHKLLSFLMDHSKDMNEVVQAHDFMVNTVRSLEKLSKKEKIEFFKQHYGGRGAVLTDADHAFVKEGVQLGDETTIVFKESATEEDAVNLPTTVVAVFEDFAGNQVYLLDGYLEHIFKYKEKTILSPLLKPIPEGKELEKFSIIVSNMLQHPDSLYYDHKYKSFLYGKKFDSEEYFIPVRPEGKITTLYHRKFIYKKPAYSKIQSKFEKIF